MSRRTGLVMERKAYCGKGSVRKLRGMVLEELTGDTYMDKVLDRSQADVQDIHHIRAFSGSLSVSLFCLSVLCLSLPLPPLSLSLG
jgi:hypothetical protein